MITLLSVTAHWAIPGLQTGGAFTDWRDDGFKRVFQDHDLWPDSAKQVGHFLTAVGMGLVPELVERPIALLIRANRYSAGIEGRVKRFLADAFLFMTSAFRTNIAVGDAVANLTDTTTIKNVILGDKAGNVPNEQFCVRLIVAQ